jgi:protein-S-isoprenylcysteine O-methyltransferase Ste14/ribosomal protein S18 acetylase RimI-like enzyme
MSPAPSGFEVRPVRSADLPQVVARHARSLGLPEDALPLLRSTWETILQSPLALALVAVREDRILGLVLATNDRQGLASDLWSRRPKTLLASLWAAPRRTLQTLQFLAGDLRRPGAMAEILTLEVLPGEAFPGLASSLLQAAVEGLRRRGSREVWIGIPGEHAETWTTARELGFQADPETAARPGRSAAVLRGLPPAPDWRPGPFTTADRLRCALRPEILVILPIYGLVLIPFASTLAWTACLLDRRLGLPEVLPFPWNLLAAGILLAVGGGLLFWSYTFLVLEGEGGPVPPFSAKTRRLVRTGPYRIVRHPSILAKLLGVLGLGIGFNSWSFLCGVVPLLLAWSLVWNGSRQDRDLIRVFGKEYLDYRNDTPMLFPRLRQRKG